MKTLTIDVTEELRTKAKIQAIKEGKSFKKYLCELLEKDIFLKNEGLK